MYYSLFFYVQLKTILYNIIIILKKVRKGGDYNENKEYFNK